MFPSDIMTSWILGDVDIPSIDVYLRVHCKIIPTIDHIKQK